MALLEDFRTIHLNCYLVRGFIKIAVKPTLSRDLRSERGGEFISNEFNEIYKEKGIKRQVSVRNVYEVTERGGVNLLPQK